MTTLKQLQKKLSKNLIVTQQTKDLKGGSCPPPIDEGAGSGSGKGRTRNHM